MENTTLVDERNINKFNLGQPYNVEIEPSFNKNDKFYIGDLVVTFNKGYRLELRLTRALRDEIVTKLKNCY